MPDKLPLYLVVCNHFDPIWRRCWDRRFTDSGRLFASYADLEGFYLTDNLALARKYPQYKFEAESTVVVRKYVERHPERLGELRRLVQAGRFAVPGAGDNIIDTNMVLGESIVRNFLLGLLWVEEHLGQVTRVGIRNDGFGNSAQVPQVFRGCEIEWVTGLSYSSPKGDFWRGLDGSTVCTKSVPSVAWASSWRKYPPCTKCQGFALAGRRCTACGGRGIELYDCPFPAKLDDAKLRAFGAGQVQFASEELLPTSGIIAWSRRWRKQYAVRFALDEELRPEVERSLARLADPPADQVHPSTELNPNNSGTWVTRIKLKQICRRQEYALLGAEALWSLAALSGARVPHGEFQAAWRELLFTMFHDALTATHVDPAYAELLDMAAGVDSRTAKLRDGALRRMVKPQAGTFSAFNPFGHPVSSVVSAVVPARATRPALEDSQGRRIPVLETHKLDVGRVELRFLARDIPPLSARTYRLVPSRPARIRGLRRPVIENERFRVVADEHGLLAVHDKRLRARVAAAGQYRPGELILERDEGSPWATLHSDRTRCPLAEHTKLLAAEAGPGWQRLRFETKSARHMFGTIAPLAAQCTATLYEGLERVEFATQVRWNLYQARLRVALPVPYRGRGIYGIPYGQIERRAYQPWFGWAGANGDWPAVNWAGVEGRAVATALLSKGLVSYTVEKAPRASSVLLLSLLRSPATPTYLHEPEAYSMTQFDGMRDAGEHAFEYALAAYRTPFAASSVTLDAEGYNSGVCVVPGRVTLPEAPRVLSESVRLTALKRAETNGDLVLRLAEFRGRAAAAVVVLPSTVRRVQKVNLLERQGQELPVVNGRVSVTLRPWEIATLRLGIGD